MQKNSALRTPLKRARGLGASHSGTHHFWVQRASAVALIPLSVWFMVSLVTRIIGGTRGMVSGWLKEPVTALLLTAFILAMLVHARIGIQEIIADYVPHEGKKIVLTLFVNGLVYLLGGAALIAVARLHFFGI